MTRRIEPKPTPAQPDDLIISSFRVPRPIVDRFDAWVEEQNVGRRGPKLSRTDVIRGLMDWAGETRPKWEGRGG